MRGRPVAKIESIDRYNTQYTLRNDRAFMAAPTLPPEITLMVAQCDTVTFRAMLTLPPIVAMVRDPHMLAAIQRNFTTRATNEVGTTTYTLCGRLHHVDQPAITYANGDQIWYCHGKR